MQLCSLLYFNLLIKSVKTVDGDYDNLSETTSETRMTSIKFEVQEEGQVYNKCEISITDDDVIPGRKKEVFNNIIFSPYSRWSYSALTFFLCLVSIAFGVFYFMNRKFINSAICGGIFFGLIFLTIIYLCSYKCWERRISKNYQQRRYNKI